MTVFLVTGCASTRVNESNSGRSIPGHRLQSDAVITDPTCRAQQQQVEQEEKARNSLSSRSTAYWAGVECQRAQNQAVLANLATMASQDSSAAYQWAELCADRSYVAPSGFVVRPAQFCTPRNRYQTELVRNGYRDNLARDRAFAKKDEANRLLMEGMRKAGDSTIPRLQ